MEEVVLKVKVEGTGDGEAKIKTVKQQLKEAKEAALQAKEGTEEYFAALQKAAGLADQLKDVNEAINTLDPGAKAAAFGNLINGIAGGFQAITGLYGLLGEKSEDLEKLLLRVQAASALAMGVQSLVEASEQWGRLKLVVIDAFDAIKKAGTAAQLGLIGIAAAVVAVIYQLATMNKTTQKLIENTDEYNKSAAEEISKLQVLTKVAKDENRSKADRQKAIEAINKLSPKYLGNITLETINTDKATIATNKYVASLIAKAKAQAAQEELTKRYKDLINLQIEFNKLDAKALSDTTIRGEIAAKQYQVIGDAYRKTVADIQTLTGMVMSNDDVIEDMFDKGEERIMKQTDLLTDLAYAYITVGEELQRLNLVPDEQVVKGIDNLDQFLYAYEDYNNEIIAGSNEVASVQVANDNMVAQQRQEAIQRSFAMAQGAANALNALNDLITQNEMQGLKKGEALSKDIQRKQFARGKALAMVNTTINTAEAIVSALKIDPTGVLSIINATIGAIQLAAIASKRFNPDTGTGDTGGAPSPMIAGEGFTPPSIQPPTNTSGFLQQDEQNFKVYVVESDITNTQQGVQQNKKKALLTI